MTKRLFYLSLFTLLIGCATRSGTNKLVVWENANIPQAYEVVGPISVNEQIAEKTDEMIQGVAGFISKDGRVSGQIPPEMKTALDIKRDQYKERIFDLLSEKAKPYGADAIILTDYTYVPPYVSFSSRATVSAKGTMIRYR